MFDEGRAPAPVASTLDRPNAAVIRRLAGDQAGRVLSRSDDPGFICNARVARRNRMATDAGETAVTGAANGRAPK